MNPIYVFTARGTATAGWALTAAMVPTTTDPTDHGQSVSVSASCARAADFCDETGTLGKTAKLGQIPATDLSLSSAYTCSPGPTNHNPVPAPRTSGAFGTGLTATDGTFTGRTLSLCTAPAGTGGGRFDVSGGVFTLTVPTVVRPGRYVGTVEYTLVSIA